MNTLNTLPHDGACHVLLVEDDPDDYILVRDWLSLGGSSRYEIAWAQSFEQAMLALENTRPHVLLVDYDLGARSGLDFVQEALKHGCEAPIILLTGRGSYTVDLQAMDAGVSDYLAKAETTPQLLERAIRFAIRHKRAELALRSANELLEARVKERTHALQTKNAELEAEIARRQRVERELAEVQRRLLDRAESERLELARELHDGPMQELYALRMQIKDFEKELKDPGLRTTAFLFQRKIQEIVQYLRMMAGELRPPALAPFGLEKAIRSHVERNAWTQPGVQIHLDLEPDGRCLPEPVRLALFRIYQVALNNIFRHAGASQVNIRLRLEPERVVLEIEDNGRGFQVPERLFEFVPQGHLGLVGASERASAVGGRLEIHSEPGQGTLLRVEVPRQPDA